MEYGNLVGYFVDCAKAFSGEEPMRRVRDRMGKEIGRAIQERVSPASIRKGIQILVDRGLDPSRLPECIFTAQQRPDTLVGPERRRAEEERLLLKTLLDDHDGRWPTGCRMVRGTHSAAHVWEPLGYDPRPHDFPHERPTREQVIAALRERSG